MKIKINKIIKNIEDINNTDFVLSCDPMLKTHHYRKVLNNFFPKIQNKNQYKFLTEDGGEFKTSKIHRMWVKKEFREWEWISAENICVNDYVLNCDFENIKIIKIITNDVLWKDEIFYDLEVEEFHNYFAGKNTFLLSHNSATINFPIFNYEIEDIIKLKDMKTGTHDNRVPHLDYSISISKLFYERFLKNENITLFSTHNTPNLYESFGHPEFDALYKKYEDDETITFKKVIPARELFSNIVREMINTGRIYILNIDNVNQHGSWNEPVYMSNLCQEVLQNIDPIKSINDQTGEIGVCILSAVNWLETKENELEKVCDVIVRMLDEIIDIQDYFSTSAKNFAQNKRSLGIGVTNLAAYVAYNDVKYSDNSALELVNTYMEKQQYYLIKSSIELAKEKGICNRFSTSKYSKGLLPIDWKKKDSELINKFSLSMNWEELRKDIKEFGMRHTTLTCCMPVESSSVTQNATNGIEPVRKLFTYKGSKKSSIPLIVPNAKKLLENYELAFSRKDNIGYLNICGVLQKWIDMGISVNLYYNPENYPDKKIPYSQVLSEILHHYKSGGKTIYYTNTDDGNIHFEKVEEKTESGCDGGSCTL